MDARPCGAYAQLREVRPVSDTTRLAALTEAGLLHPNPDAVLAPLFTGGSDFFLAADKVQVKYEMLRARLVEGVPVAEAAAAHGYSRAAFYLVAAAFEQLGMAGLIDERRGRRGPVKLRPEIVDFIGAARPAWSPHEDLRVAALAAGYEFLLAAAARVDSVAGLALPGGGLR